MAVTKKNGQQSRSREELTKCFFSGFPPHQTLPLKSQTGSNLFMIGRCIQSNKMRVISFILCLLPNCNSGAGGRVDGWVDRWVGENVKGKWHIAGCWRIHHSLKTGCVVVVISFKIFLNCHLAPECWWTCTDFYASRRGWVKTFFSCFHSFDVGG